MPLRWRHIGALDNAGCKKDCLSNAECMVGIGIYLKPNEQVSYLSPRGFRALFLQAMLRTINDMFRTVVVIWLTLSVGSVILAGITWIQLSQRLAASTEAVALRDAVDGVLKLLLDIETGQRGFTITGDEPFLEPLKRSETELPAQFDRLADLARRDPALLKLVMNLRAEAETGRASCRERV